MDNKKINDIKKYEDIVYCIDILENIKNNLQDYTEEETLKIYQFLASIEKI